MLHFLLAIAVLGTPLDDRPRGYSGGPLASAACFPDDVQLGFGAGTTLSCGDEDYHMVYNSSGTALEFWALDCDGVSTACVWLKVLDGTDDLIIPNDDAYLGFGGGTGGDVRHSFTGADFLTLLQAVGDTYGWVIALEDTPPAADGEMIHIWAGSAGTATCNAAAKMCFEDDATFYLHFLTPDASAAGFYFGDDAADIQGSIAYGNSSHATWPNAFRFTANGNTEFLDLARYTATLLQSYTILTQHRSDTTATDPIVIQTGDQSNAGAHNSGGLTFETGSANGGGTGDFTLRTGASAAGEANAGDLVFQTHGTNTRCTIAGNGGGFTCTADMTLLADDEPFAIGAGGAAADCYLIHNSTLSTLEVFCGAGAANGWTWNTTQTGGIWYMPDDSYVGPIIDMQLTAGTAGDDRGYCLGLGNTCQLYVFAESDGAVHKQNPRIGIMTNTPEYSVEVEDTNAHLGLTSTVAEDTDGGREAQINFQGTQSGGEETHLARIEASHDGAADDQKGKLVFATNDGTDGDTPTTALTIDSSQNLIVPVYAVDHTLLSTGAVLGPTAPDQNQISDSCAGLGFDNANETVVLKFEVPDCYADGASDDLTLNIYWCPTSGDAPQDTEDVDFDISWRSYLFGTEDVDSGVLATGTVTRTQSGAGDDKDSFKDTITLPASGGNQPIDVGDDIVITFYRDTASESNSYSGNAIAHKWELTVPQTKLKCDHQ
jgi:hypothetical protein